MAKKRRPPSGPGPGLVTAKRIPRLYRLLQLLGKGPQTRDLLTRKLGLNLRAFYRDLKVLRAMGIDVNLRQGRYVLTGRVGDALARLPFPDPGLTLAEAMQLAKGRTQAHRKLKGQIEAITG